MANKLSEQDKQFYLCIKSVMDCDSFQRFRELYGPLKRLEELGMPKTALYLMNKAHRKVTGDERPLIEEVKISPSETGFYDRLNLEARE